MMGMLRHLDAKARMVFSIDRKAREVMAVRDEFYVARVVSTVQAIDS